MLCSLTSHWWCTGSTWMTHRWHHVLWTMGDVWVSMAAAGVPERTVPALLEGLCWCGGTWRSLGYQKCHASICTALVQMQMFLLINLFCTCFVRILSSLARDLLRSLKWGSCLQIQWEAADTCMGPPKYVCISQFFQEDIVVCRKDEIREEALSIGQAVTCSGAIGSSHHCNPKRDAQQRDAVEGAQLFF